MYCLHTFSDMWKIQITKKSLFLTSSPPARLIEPIKSVSSTLRWLPSRPRRIPYSSSWVHQQVPVSRNSILFRRHIARNQLKRQLRTPTVELGVLFSPNRTPGKRLARSTSILLRDIFYSQRFLCVFDEPQGSTIDSQIAIKKSGKNWIENRKKYYLARFAMPQANR